MHHLALGHLIISALVRGVIYGLIWKTMRHMTPPEAAFLAIAVLGVVVIVGAAANRRRQW